MTTIALFGTADDRAYLPRFNELIAPYGSKVSLSPESYLVSIAAKVKANKIDSIICSCAETMTVLLTALPDFRHPLDKRDNKRKLSLMTMQVHALRLLLTGWEQKLMCVC